MTQPSDHRIALLQVGTHEIPVELPIPMRPGDPGWEQQAIRAVAHAFRDYFDTKEAA